MSSTPALSALHAETETYPLLTVEQIARVRPFARLRSVEAGEVLYRPGDMGVPFYLLLSTCIEVVQPDGQDEKPVAVLYPRMFTGEAAMISGQPTIALARTLVPGEVLEVLPEDLRTFAARDSQVSEILLRAFMLRRLMLITRQLGNVVVLGSRHSTETVRLREFLGRNSHPYTYVDLDTDAASQALLDRFAVTVKEIPIVICNGRTVLRNPSILELADSSG
jgi:thioredoxin reductase (NADPH)